MRLRTALIGSLILLSACAGGVYLLGRYHFRAAQAALAREAFDEAQAELEQCLRVWPRSAPAHLLAARTARRRHAYELAEQQLADCKRLQANEEAVALESVLIKVQQGYFAGTEDMLHDLVAGNSPDASIILAGLAEGYVHTFQSQKALLTINELLSRQPANANAFALRGRVWEILLKDEQALRDYERAVELGPELDEGRLRLADMLAKLGRTREALAQYRCLRRRQPDNLAVAVGLAHCLHDLAELKEARELLDSVLPSHPEHVAALVERGRVAIRQGELENAESWLRKAVSLAPLDQDAHVVYHACLVAEQKQEEANNVLTVVNKLATDYTRLKILMMKVGEAPREASFPCDIGIILLRNGREEEGVNWLKKALELDPGYTRARVALREHARQKSNPGQ